MDRRDGFKPNIKDKLAKSVCYKCSNRNCRKGTSAATEQGGISNVGEAAHICAASSGGARYDADMSQEERTSFDNGIWLCCSCAKMIDDDEKTYTVELLKEWKNEAEEKAREEMFAGKCCEQECTILIKSFLMNAIRIEDKSMSVIDLTDCFEGRFLREGISWDSVFLKIKDYITLNVIWGNRYFIEFSALYSIAFMVGRIMNPKCGYIAVPFQSTLNKNKIWDINDSDTKHYEELTVEMTTVDNGKTDIAVVIGITKNINIEVKEFVEDQELMIGMICYCYFPVPSNSCIEDSVHARKISEQIDQCIAECLNVNKKGKIHIFAASPVSVIFHLGQRSLAYGKGIYYEYDFEKKRLGTYYPGIKFLEGDWEIG